MNQYIEGHEGPVVKQCIRLNRIHEFNKKN